MMLRLVLAVCALWAVPAMAQIKVVAVAYPLAWLASELGGSGVEVSYPVPADRDAEFWRPGISQIAEIQAADVILLNGAGFAGWTERVSLPRRAVVQTTRGLEDQFITIEAVTHSHGGDTHSHDATATFTWMDPALLAQKGVLIAAALERRGVAVDRAVLAELTNLADDIATLPAGAWATSHPRYQYLARRAEVELYELEAEAGADLSADELQAVANWPVDALLMERAPNTLPSVEIPVIVWPTFGAAASDADVLATWRAAYEQLAAALKAAEPS